MGLLRALRTLATPDSARSRSLRGSPAESSGQASQPATPNRTPDSIRSRPPYKVPAESPSVPPVVPTGRMTPDSARSRSPYLGPHTPQESVASTIDYARSVASTIDYGVQPDVSPEARTVSGNKRDPPGSPGSVKRPTKASRAGQDPVHQHPGARESGSSDDPAVQLPVPDTESEEGSDLEEAFATWKAELDHEVDCTDFSAAHQTVFRTAEFLRTAGEAHDLAVLNTSFSGFRWTHRDL